MNLGYACINMTLSNREPRITTNRGMVKRTFLNKGTEYAGALALLNVVEPSELNVTGLILKRLRISRFTIPILVFASKSLSKSFVAAV